MAWTPMNRRAKFEAASFILGGEIRNRTNKQTNTQTVTDISTPCLSECVDNNRYTHTANVCTSQLTVHQFKFLVSHLDANPRPIHSFIHLLRQEDSIKTHKYTNI